MLALYGQVASLEELCAIAALQVTQEQLLSITLVFLHIYLETAEGQETFHSALCMEAGAPWG